MTSKLDFYTKRFANLRKDKNRSKYPEHTRHSAPHKPLLLLAVADLFAEGSISENMIPLTPLLQDTFSGYWNCIMPLTWRGDIAMPFYHLTGDNFWHLVPRSGSEEVLESGRRLRSIRLLHDHTKGARLDDDLFGLLCGEEARNILRASLIEAHFTPEVHESLIEQGTLNVESFRYSRELLEQARGEQRVKDPVSSSDLPDPIRDQGFRRAIVEAYDHRCAISGIRILTSDYHTAVEAAHIIPWSVSHNDDPRNGLALSKLCHWAFEEGLLTISNDYAIRLSPELAASQNAPGYLGTLEGRSVYLPEDPRLQPGLEYLAWHRERKFRD
jgi:putative restriction endonuclease